MNYAKTRIPKRFWGVTLKDYDTDRGEPAVRDAVAEYLNDLPEHLEAGTGLTLSGPPGIGKTMLMCIIGMAVADEGCNVLYMPFARYVKHLLNLIAWQGDEEMHDEWLAAQQTTLDIRNKVKFLLLDDVGKEHSTHTGFAEDEFDFMVRMRYDKVLPTIITTNKPVDEWNMRYSDAMQSFASEAFPEVYWAGRDQRQRRD